MCAPLLAQNLFAPPRLYARGLFPPKPGPRRADSLADTPLWLRAVSPCSYPLIQATHSAKADPPSKSVLYFAPTPTPQVLFFLREGREAFFERSMLNRFSVYSNPRSDCLPQNLQNSSRYIQTGALFFHPSSAWESSLLLFGMHLDPTCSLKASFSGLPPPWNPAGCPHLPAPSVLCN